MEPIIYVKEPYVKFEKAKRYHINNGITLLNFDPVY